MTIAFRGAAKVSTTANGADATINFDATALPRENDVVVLFGGRANTSDANAWGPITSGYTLVASIDSTGPKFGIWTKKMGATPDTSVDVEGGGNTAHGTAYGVFVIDGTTVDPDDLYDATLVSTGQVTAVPDAPSITTVTANARVIAFGYNSVNDISRGAVSGFTTIIGTNANDTDDISIEAVYQDVASPGAVDPGAWSTWTSGIGGAITIAIKPLAATPSTGSGSPVATLSATASGTVKTKFSGSGAPVTSLSPTASGTASLIFNASGTPVATLSATADGVASLTIAFHASGSPVASLSPTASGTAKLTFHASGSPVTSLSATASGDASMTTGDATGSGAPVATLSATASGTVKMTFHAAGAPVTTLSATASGAATSQPVFSASGSPVTTLSAFATGDATLEITITASGAPARRLSAFASGEALNPDGGEPPVRRRARGFLVINEEEEAIKKEEEELEEAVEAQPLPDIEPIPVVESITRNPIPKVVVPKISQRISAPEPTYDDDEEVLIQLLGII